MNERCNSVLNAKHRNPQYNVPYFQSDIYGVRLQLLGSAHEANQIEIVHENPDKRAFVAEYRKDGELIGVAECNAGAKTVHYMSQLVRDLKSLRSREIVSGAKPER